SQAGRLVAQYRAAAHRHRQLVVFAFGQRQEIDAVPRGTRLPRGIGRARRDGIPRTDLLTHIASVDAGADARVVLPRDVAAKLDRQVRHAPGRIEHPGRDERAGRTRLEAQCAGAALVERWRIHLERQTADDLGEKDPGPERRVDDAGVLANPADAGVLRIHTLLHRTGVDVGARVERLSRLFAHPSEQALEALADHVVIIVAPCVARDQ